MEPLSIGSAVVGIISASVRLGKPLYTLTVGLTNAPNNAVSLQNELNVIQHALELLQKYLIGAENLDSSRKSLLSLRNIVATLTGCVTTYSKLEEIVRKCTSTGEISGVISRAKWALHEEEIDRMVGRLRDHKLSMILMLTTLQCESMLEATESVQRLENLIDSILESNRDLRDRIDSLESSHDPAFGIRAMQSHRARSTLIAKRFKDVLRKCGVHRRAENRQVSLCSLSSPQQESLAMSAFSDLSLGDVSRISLLCLPVWSTDLSNGYHYWFGKVNLEPTIRYLAQHYPLGLRMDGNGSQHAFMHPRKPPPIPSSRKTAERITFLVPISQQVHIASKPTTDGSSVRGDTAMVASVSDNQKDDEPKVLFRVRCHIGNPNPLTQNINGMPFHKYDPGDMFDVFADEGPIWLAGKLDVEMRPMGWIMKKHFEQIPLTRITIGGNSEEYAEYTETM